MINLKNRLEEIVKQGKLKPNEPLAQYTTLKIGGPAEFFIETNHPQELSALWKLHNHSQVPTKIIGGGSNLLFKDAGFSGVIIKLSNAEYQLDHSQQLPVVTFPAGYSSHLASLKVLELGYSGFEGLHGLPGTIGGAIYMNSKWPKEHFQTADNLISVDYLNSEGELITVLKPALRFAYGYSSFQEKNWLILSAKFAFRPEEVAEIKRRYTNVLNYRRTTQPIGVKTAGCVFKNITPEEQSQNNLPTASVGYLIDQCGLKGMQIGQMAVSVVHANFFVNLGQATAQEYQKLVQIVRQAVKTKFKIDLKEEVDFVE